MDPNMALHELRELVTQVQATTDTVTIAGAREDLEKLARIAPDLAEAFDALDGWLTKGGFLPHAWSEQRDHR